MKTQTKWQRYLKWYREYFGLTYLVNKGTKEIHDLSKANLYCGANMVVKRKYVTRKKMIKMCASKKYNGCAKCNNEYDRG